MIFELSVFANKLFIYKYFISTNNVLSLWYHSIYFKINVFIYMEVIILKEDHICGSMVLKMFEPH